MSYESNVDTLHQANVVDKDQLSDHMTQQINEKLDADDVAALQQIRSKMDDHEDPNSNIF